MYTSSILLQDILGMYRSTNIWRTKQEGTQTNFPRNITTSVQLAWKPASKPISMEPASQPIRKPRGGSLLAAQLPDCREILLWPAVPVLERLGVWVLAQILSIGTNTSIGISQLTGLITKIANLETFSNSAHFLVKLCCPSSAKHSVRWFGLLPPEGVK